MHGARARIAIAFALATMAVCFAAAPAGAALRWTKPETLMDGGYPGTVAIDARGDVLAIWQRNVSAGTSETFYAWRAPRGEWTEPRRIDVSRPHGGLSVSLTPRGAATVGWLDAAGNVRVADARAGGSFDRPEVVASGVHRGGGVRLTTDDAGNALVAWLDPIPTGRMNAGATIFAASRRAGGEWSKPENLSGDVAGAGPFVAMNAAGAAVVEWMTVVGGLPEVAYRPPAGGFGAVERPPLGGPTYPSNIAVDDTGRVHIATGSPAFRPGPVRTVMTTRSPLGGWSDPLEIETPGAAPSSLHVQPDGTANLLMNNYDDQGHNRVQFATRRPDGTVVGPFTLADDAVAGRGAMNLRGDVLAGWATPPEGQKAKGPVRVADKLSNLTAFGPPVTVSSAPGVFPEFALNDARQAAAVWAAGGYGNPSFVVAVREDPTDPVLPFPPAVDVDAPIPTIDGDGDLLVPVTCSGACTANASGIVATGGGDELRRGSAKSRRLTAKRRSRLTLDFGSAGAKAVRRAIKAGRKPTVYLSVRARGKSPRPMTVSRRVRLR